MNFCSCKAIVRSRNTECKHKSFLSSGMNNCSIVTVKNVFLLSEHLDVIKLNFMCLKSSMDAKSLGHCHDQGCI
jgi:hypothetical protein